MKEEANMSEELDEENKDKGFVAPKTGEKPNQESQESWEIQKEKFFKEICNQGEAGIPALREHLLKEFGYAEHEPIDADKLNDSDMSDTAKLSGSWAAGMNEGDIMLEIPNWREQGVSDKLHDTIKAFYEQKGFETKPGNSSDDLIVEKYDQGRYLTVIYGKTTLIGW